MKPEEVKITKWDVLSRVGGFSILAYFSAHAYHEGYWWYMIFLLFLTAQWLLAFALGKWYIAKETKRLNWEFEEIKRKRRDLFIVEGDLERREQLIEASSGTQKERERILKMIEAGLITPEQAQALYEKIILAYQMDDSDAVDLPPHPIEMNDEEFLEHWDADFKEK